MRDLRADGWLAAGPYGYAVLDREAVEFFLRTRAAIFPGMTIAQIFDVREGPLYEEMRRNILHINGPDHTRLRSLVNPALSPRAVERYRPVMRELLEGISEGRGGWRGCRCRRARPTGVGRGTAHGHLRVRARRRQALPLAGDRARDGGALGGCAAAAPLVELDSAPIRRDLDDRAESRDRTGGVGVLRVRVGPGARTARAPGEDLISLLIAAEEQGERLSDVECVNLVLNILIGGVDTTQSQLAHAVRLLAEHPDQWQLLGERAELAAQAVEEALRYEPITPFTARILVEELTFRDVIFPEGTIVMVCAFTGNRDLPGAGGAAGGAGGDLDRFDIAAERDRARVLTFGAGVHFCVGANLARVELQEALAFLAPRMPGLELAGEPVFEGITGIYGLGELPLQWRCGF